MKVLSLNNGVVSQANVQGEAVTELVNTSSGNSVIVPAPTTDVIKFTNAGLTEIKEVVYTSSRTTVVLVNETGVTFVIAPNYSANGIVMGAATTIEVPNKTALKLVYSSTLSRWVVVGIIGSFVDSVSDQTIAGTKTFSGMLTVTGGSDFTFPPLLRAGIDVYSPVGTGTTSILPNDSMVDLIYWTLPASQGGVNTYLKNDGSGNLSWATPAGGGGGSLNTTSTTVDFGVVGGYVTATVSASWVTSTSVISLTITPNLTDHDYEDVLIEELKCTIGAIVNGVSFDIHVHAPNETWGRYIIKAQGA